MNIAIDMREVAGNRAGKGHYVFELVNHLAKIDHKNRYFLYTKEQFSWELPKNFVIRVVSGRSILWHRNLAKQMLADKIDVFLATLSYLSAVFSKVPTVLVVHDLAVFYAPIKSKRKSVLSERLTLNRAIKKARAIITISESTKKELIRFNPESAQKITTVDLAASDRFKQRTKGESAVILKKFNLQPGYIFFAGTLEPRKNVTSLIRAYAKLPDDLRDKHPLVIAGKKGWFYDEIFFVVKELRLENKVQFLGYVKNEELPLLYNGSGLFAFPSVYEGFGLPVLEAIKSGVPVITSRTDALTEVGGSATVAVDPSDSQKFADQINSVLTNDKFAAELVSRGLEYVKKYDWNRTARETLKILSSCKV